MVYLGDHANVPYGDRASDEIVALTRNGVAALFRRDCKLVLLGCNTATCVAARTLQKDWLGVSGWPGRNILGIVAPTVEAATQTPWAVTTPQYPQKYNTDLIAVFGTTQNDRVARLSGRDPQALPAGDGGAADLRGGWQAPSSEGAPSLTSMAWWSAA